MPWMIMVIFLTLLDTLSSEVACISLADIYWNATNPIFRIDNTDHIIDVNKNNPPFEYDQVNIICPSYPHSNKGTKTEDEEEDEESERYIIYNVSKEEYDSCRITNPNPRRIAVCDKPNQLMYFTITFRSFTPQPGGLEFLPGHDYYFVSTSTGDLKGLHQLVGGRCATHNMKVIFKVCCSPSKDNPTGSDISNHQTSTVNVSLPASSMPPLQPNIVNSSSRPPAKMRPSTPATPVTTVPRWVRPTHPIKPYEVPIEDEMDKSPTHSTDKNKVEVDKTQKRDRTKNQEWVDSSSAHRHRWSGHHGAYTCVAICLLYHLLTTSLLCR